MGKDKKVRQHPVPSVKVAPYTFAVAYDRHLADKGSVAGICMEDVERIYIDENNGWMTDRETLLHELLHAVWGQTTLNAKDMYGDEEEEKIVYTLAPRLLALLRDNPDLVAFLTEEE